MVDGFDAFLESRVRPEHREIVTRFCQQIVEVGSEAALRMRGGTEDYYSVPVYRVKRDIVAISPTQKGVTFSFTYGAAFNDPEGLMSGSGKRSRTVRVAKLDRYPDEAMAGFIRQAIALDLA